MFGRPGRALGWGGKEARMSPGFRLEHLGTQDGHLSWASFRADNQKFHFGHVNLERRLVTPHHPE